MSLVDEAGKRGRSPALYRSCDGTWVHWFILFTYIICIHVINFRLMGNIVSNEINKVCVPWNL